ncbi:tetratricopeptide repeat protein [Altererythrobacter aquiaggeris]|uniref:tetratricopeptide repeat protein n=1 Tax=Aestuarierythrobacter aquiaggeris TaxID=1898396 RepID=UPI00301AE5FF
MIWIALISMALLVFGSAVYFLDLPRSLWAMFGTVMALGLAGYALQGSPLQPGAPAAVGGKAAHNGEALVTARREMLDDGYPPSRFVTIADGFARKGQFADAAGLLQGAVAQNPGDSEAWLAMAIALVEHAEGQVSPAALDAFSRAIETRSDSPAPGYFLGIAYLRAGDPLRTRAIWGEMLARTPDDAPWRGDLQFRIARLDELLAASGAADQPPLP